MRASGILVALVTGAASAPVMADQHLMAADNGTVECVVSQKDLTRVSLVGDAFASVSKVGTGVPYNDFSIQHEPVRGDIYLSVPEAYAPRMLSFFATTRKGFTYKFQCGIRPIGAEQIFITNPAIGEAKAARWEKETPLQTTAIRLIEAMYGNHLIDGYQILQPGTGMTRDGNLRVRVVSEYRGAALTGRVIEIKNTGPNVMEVSEATIAPRNALAVAIGETRLAAGGMTVAYIVQPRGE